MMFLTVKEDLEKDRYVASEAFSELMAIRYKFLEFQDFPPAGSITYSKVTLDRKESYSSNFLRLSIYFLLSNITILKIRQGLKS